MNPFTLKEQELNRISDEQRIEWIEDQIEATLEYIRPLYQNEWNRTEVYKRMITSNNKTHLKSQYLFQKPEAFVEQNIVWPLLSLLGYEYRIEATEAGVNDYFDFLTTNTSLPIIGEVKRQGHHHKASAEILPYLKKSQSDYGITTDGFYWELVKIEMDNGAAKLRKIRTGDLRGVVAVYIRKNGDVSDRIIDDLSNIPTIGVADFYEMFNQESLNKDL